MVAMTEEQWGRVLAKAWTDQSFQDLLETDPKVAVGAVQAQFGIMNAKLLDLSSMDSTNDGYTLLQQMSVTDLNDIIATGMLNNQKVLKDDMWVLQGGTVSISDVAKIYEPGLAMKTKKQPLTSQQWAQIYAQIWKDDLFGGPQKKNYKTNFENDPADAVAKIVQDNPGMGINYQKGVTPLFVIVPRPSGLTPTMLQQIVNTGQSGGQILKLIVRKCC
jgi:hypothetical protein